MKLKAVAMPFATLALAASLVACGTSASSVASSNGSSDSNVGQQASTTPDVKLSDYESLEPGDCVLVYPDGTKEEHKNYVKGGIVDTSGLEYLSKQLEKESSDKVNTKAKYDGAYLVLKGVVTTIEDKDSDHDCILGVAHRYSVLGDKVLFPQANVELTEQDIRDKGIKTESTIIAAGYLNAEYIVKSSKLTGLRRYVWVAEPALVELV